MNVNKLRGKLVENGITVAELAESLGLNPATLYRKLKENGDSLTIGEAGRIVDLLHLEASEAMQIFLP